MGNIRITKTLVFFASLLLLQSAKGQGRVVINEMMPWSGCNTTSEFIELLNFGPGPANIGCYIVTNGKYSVTIPPNTILQPGQYYLLSGQASIYKNCTAKDTLLPVDLNWTTCGCTNTPIPTTGDGFMDNGGNANEKLVLLTPNLTVADAVTRSLPASASNPITTASLGGGCSSQTFNLSSMNITYEEMGTSTGIDNSFARKVDGDCGWVKTTSTSPKEPNKTGSTSSATYSFTTLSASDCSGTTGSISIGVSASDVNAIFPMTYTLAYDQNSNSSFETSDTYNNGADSTPSSIDIKNLVYGRYRITVASASGCNLKSWDFFIFNCYGVVLPVKLVNFKYLGNRNNEQWFNCEVEGKESLQSLVLEGSDGSDFKTITTITDFSPFPLGNITIKAPVSTYKQYRVRLVSKASAVNYSPAITVTTAAITEKQLWPNPVTDKLYLQVAAGYSGKSQYTIANSTGVTVAQGSLALDPNTMVYPLSVNNLTPGMYYLKLSAGPTGQPISFRFVKH